MAYSCAYSYAYSYALSAGALGVPNLLDSNYALYNSYSNSIAANASAYSNAAKSAGSAASSNASAASSANAVLSSYTTDYNAQMSAYSSNAAAASSASSLASSYADAGNAYVGSYAVLMGEQASAVESAISVANSQLSSLSTVYQSVASSGASQASLATVIANDAGVASSAADVAAPFVNSPSLVATASSAANAALQASSAASVASSIASSAAIALKSAQSLQASLVAAGDVKSALYNSVATVVTSLSAQQSSAIAAASSANEIFASDSAIAASANSQIASMANSLVSGGQAGVNAALQNAGMMTLSSAVASNSSLMQSLADINNLSAATVGNYVTTVNSGAIVDITMSANPATNKLLSSAMSSAANSANASLGAVTNAIGKLKTDVDGGVASLAAQALQVIDMNNAILKTLGAGTTQNLMSADAMKALIESIMSPSAAASMEASAATAGNLIAGTVGNLTNGATSLINLILGNSILSGAFTQFGVSNPLNQLQILGQAVIEDSTQALSPIQNLVNNLQAYQQQVNNAQAQIAAASQSIIDYINGFANGKTFNYSTVANVSQDEDGNYVVSVGGVNYKLAATQSVTNLMNNFQQAVAAAAALVDNCSINGDLLTAINNVAKNGVSSTPLGTGVAAIVQQGTNALLDPLANAVNSWKNGLTVAGVNVGGLLPDLDLHSSAGLATWVDFFTNNPVGQAASALPGVGDLINILKTVGSLTSGLDGVISSSVTTLNNVSNNLNTTITTDNKSVALTGDIAKTVSNNVISAVNNALNTIQDSVDSGNTLYTAGIGAKTAIGFVAADPAAEIANDLTTAGDLAGSVPGVTTDLTTERQQTNVFAPETFTVKATAVNANNPSGAPVTVGNGSTTVVYQYVAPVVNGIVEAINNNTGDVVGSYAFSKYGDESVSAPDAAGYLSNAGLTLRSDQPAEQSLTADQLSSYYAASNAYIADSTAYDKAVAMGDSDAAMTSDQAAMTAAATIKFYYNDSNDGSGNVGSNNTGDNNTGDNNVGSDNSGDNNTGSSNIGSDNSGDNNTGSSNIGSDNSGDNNTGSSNVGSDNSGDNNTGNNNAGSDNSGDNNVGNSNVGSDNSGDNNVGSNNSGDNNTGNNNAGSDNSGDNNVGNSNVGSDNSGDNNTGNSNVGSDNSGDNNTGNSNVGSDNSGDNNVGDSNVGSNNTGDNNVGNSNVGSNNISDNNTGNNNVGSDNSGNDNVGNNNVGNGNEGDGNTGNYLVGNDLVAPTLYLKDLTYSNGKAIYTGQWDVVQSFDHLYYSDPITLTASQAKFVNKTASGKFDIDVPDGSVEYILSDFPDQAGQTYEIKFMFGDFDHTNWKTIGLTPEQLLHMIETTPNGQIGDYVWKTEIIQVKNPDVPTVTVPGGPNGNEGGSNANGNGGNNNDNMINNAANDAANQLANGKSMNDVKIGGTFSTNGGMNVNNNGGNGVTSLTGKNGEKITLQAAGTLPDTGDENNAVGLTIAGVLSAIGLAFAGMKRKKNEE